MGNACLSGDAAADPRPSPSPRNWPNGGSSTSTAGGGGGGGGGSSGQTLGGDVHVQRALRPGEAAAAAAAARAAAGGAKTVALDERRRKDELVGRLQHLYELRGRAVPLGLPSMGLKQLEALYAGMRGAAQD